jgi:hypothetical protein
MPGRRGCQLQPQQRDGAPGPLSVSGQSGGLSPCGRLLLGVTKDDLVDLSPREACNKIIHADDITREADDFAERSSLIVLSNQVAGPLLPSLVRVCPMTSCWGLKQTNLLCTISPDRVLGMGSLLTAVAVDLRADLESTNWRRAPFYLLSERYQFATAQRFASFA